MSGGDTEGAGRPSPFLPKCIFCDAPWTPEMDGDLYTSQGCETCGYGSETTGTLRIKCDQCGRVVYEKEYRSSY